MRLELVRKYLNSEEYKKKLIIREERWNKIEENPISFYKDILEIYSVNPIEFIETFGFIKITKLDTKDYPLFLFDYQKKILLKVWESEVDENEHEIFIDKPREMGLTWLFVWYFIWRWLFKEGWSGFVISRKEDEVDDGTANPEGSIFGKIRWGLNRLPDILLPTGFISRSAGKRGSLTDLKLKIINPVMESVIHGSSSASHTGRSRRYSFVFVDEFFAIENAFSIYRALQSVSKVKAFITTLAEFDPRFEQFKELAKQKGEYISLTWKDNPFKDEIWYQEQLQKLQFDPDIIREIEPVYTVNPELRYYPEADNVEEKELEYNSELPLYASIDIGSNDLTVIVWYQYTGEKINVLEAFWDRRRDLEYYVPLLSKKLVPDYSKYDDKRLKILKKVREWREPLYVFGEMAHVQQRMPYNVSDAQILRKYGIRFTYNAYEGGALGGHRLRRRSVSLILPFSVFNKNSEGVMLVLKSLKMARFVEPTHRSAGKNAYGSPVHDRLADFRAAFENFAMNFVKVIRTAKNVGVKIYSGIGLLFTPKGQLIEQTKWKKNYLNQ